MTEVGQNRKEQLFPIAAEFRLTQCIARFGLAEKFDHGFSN